MNSYIYKYIYKYIPICICIYIHFFFISMYLYVHIYIGGNEISKDVRKTSFSDVNSIMSDGNSETPFDIDQVLTCIHIHFIRI
jgi:hypothetical protein